MILALSMILDAALGEPKTLWRRLPHPVVLMGRLIGWADTHVNQGKHRRIKGALALAMGLLGMIALGHTLSALPGPWAEIALTTILLAQRALSDHVSEVATQMHNSPQAARNAVAQIVGRDTSALDPPAIARAAIESAAENLSDGVIAPALWFALAGLPGLLCYKLVNTADSMVGYRTERHQEFGWAAARTDDLLNLIPARLTALLLWLPARQGRWPDIARDAGQHRSPNAGWPEAAMAGALGIALAGPRSYHGQTEPLPWVNPTGRRNATAFDVTKATRLLWTAWALMLAATLATAAL